MIKQKISHSNRGKALQNVINLTNMMYKLKGWAQIDEVPTPTQNINGRIKYAAKSTVDYVGISHGRGIAFDAKSTRELKRFPFDNVHAHQVNYLKSFRDQGGIAFFIIEFAKLHKTFFVPFNIFEEYWLEALDGGRKSIPIEALEFHCPEIKAARGVAIDYLIHCQKEKENGHESNIN